MNRGGVRGFGEAASQTPRLVAADAAFYSAKNEVTAKANGVKRFCVPNRSTKSEERKRKKRWFRNGQKWRTGCEGRISVVAQPLPLKLGCGDGEILEQSLGDHASLDEGMGRHGRRAFCI
jgi:hypothetical protein